MPTGRQEPFRICRQYEAWLVDQIGRQKEGERERRRWGKGWTDQALEGDGVGSAGLRHILPWIKVTNIEQV